MSTDGRFLIQLIANGQYVEEVDGRFRLTWAKALAYRFAWNEAVDFFTFAIVNAGERTLYRVLELDARDNAEMVVSL